MGNSIEAIAYQRRTMDFVIPIFEANGTTEVTLAAADVVRVKIGRGVGLTPDLDIDSVAPTANKSVIEFTPGTNDARLRIAQGDTASMAPGTYEMEVLVVDDSHSGPSDAIKHVQEGVFHLMGQMAGDIGLS